MANRFVGARRRWRRLVRSWRERSQKTLMQTLREVFDLTREDFNAYRTLVLGHPTQGVATAAAAYGYEQVLSDDEHSDDDAATGSAAASVARPRGRRHAGGARVVPLSLSAVVAGQPEPSRRDVVARQEDAALEAGLARRAAIRARANDASASDNDNAAHPLSPARATTYGATAASSSDAAAGVGAAAPRVASPGAQFQHLPSGVVREVTLGAGASPGRVRRGSRDPGVAALYAADDDITRSPPAALPNEIRTSTTLSALVAEAPIPERHQDSPSPHPTPPPNPEYHDWYRRLHDQGVFVILLALLESNQKSLRSAINRGSKKKATIKKFGKAVKKYQDLILKKLKTLSAFLKQIGVNAQNVNTRIFEVYQEQLYPYQRQHVLELLQVLTQLRNIKARLVAGREQPRYQGNMDGSLGARQPTIEDWFLHVCVQSDLEATINSLQTLDGVPVPRVAGAAAASSSHAPVLPLDSPSHNTEPRSIQDLLNQLPRWEDRLFNTFIERMVALDTSLEKLKNIQESFSQTNYRGALEELHRSLIGLMTFLKEHPEFRGMYLASRIEEVGALLSGRLAAAALHEVVFQDGAEEDRCDELRQESFIFSGLALLQLLEYSYGEGALTPQQAIKLVEGAGFLPGFLKRIVNAIFSKAVLVMLPFMIALGYLLFGDADLLSPIVFVSIRVLAAGLHQLLGSNYDAFVNAFDVSAFPAINNIIGNLGTLFFRLKAYAISVVLALASIVIKFVYDDKKAEFLAHPLQHAVLTGDIWEAYQNHVRGRVLFPALRVFAEGMRTLPRAEPAQEHDETRGRRRVVGGRLFDSRQRDDQELDLFQPGASRAALGVGSESRRSSFRVVGSSRDPEVPPQGSSALRPSARRRDQSGPRNVSNMLAALAPPRLGPNAQPTVVTSPTTATSARSATAPLVRTVLPPMLPSESRTPSPASVHSSPRDDAAAPRVLQAPPAEVLTRTGPQTAAPAPAASSSAAAARTSPPAGQPTTSREVGLDVDERSSRRRRGSTLASLSESSAPDDIPTAVARVLKKGDWLLSHESQSERSVEDERALQSSLGEMKEQGAQNKPSLAALVAVIKRAHWVQQGERHPHKLRAVRGVDLRTNERVGISRVATILKKAQKNRRSVCVVLALTGDREETFYVALVLEPPRNADVAQLTQIRCIDPRGHGLARHQVSGVRFDALPTNLPAGVIRRTLEETNRHFSAPAPSASSSRAVTPAVQQTNLVFTFPEVNAQVTNAHPENSAYLLAEILATEEGRRRNFTAPTNNTTAIATGRRVLLAAYPAGDIGMAYTRISGETASRSGGRSRTSSVASGRSSLSARTALSSVSTSSASSRAASPPRELAATASLASMVVAQPADSAASAAATALAASAAASSSASSALAPATPVPVAAVPASASSTNTSTAGVVVPSLALGNFVGAEATADAAESSARSTRGDAVAAAIAAFEGRGGTPTPRPPSAASTPLLSGRRSRAAAMLGGVSVSTGDTGFTTVRAEATWGSRVQAVSPPNNEVAQGDGQRIPLPGALASTLNTDVSSGENSGVTSPTMDDSDTTLPAVRFGGGRPPERRRFVSLPPLQAVAEGAGSDDQSRVLPPLTRTPSRSQLGAGQEGNDRFVNLLASTTSIGSAPSLPLGRTSSSSSSAASAAATAGSGALPALARTGSATGVTSPLPRPLMSPPPLPRPPSRGGDAAGAVAASGRSLVPALSSAAMARAAAAAAAAAAASSGRAATTATSRTNPLLPTGVTLGTARSGEGSDRPGSADSSRRLLDSARSRVASPSTTARPVSAGAPTSSARSLSARGGIVVSPNAPASPSTIEQLMARARVVTMGDARAANAAGSSSARSAASQARPSSAGSTSSTGRLLPR